MENTEPYYLQKLRRTFSQRKRNNPSYSLRAFAKDLEIDSSNLSAILKGKRQIPKHRADNFTRRLRLTPTEAKLFQLSIASGHTKLDQITFVPDKKKYLLEEAYFHVISEWEYFAFLQLMETTDFNNSPLWISKRLGIELSRTEIVIQDLKKLGFIDQDDSGNYSRKVPSLETSEDIESRALQKSHHDALEIAGKKLEQTPVTQRDFSSVTMAIDPGKLTEVKALIREFQDKLYAFLDKSEKKEVYQLNCQLFPLTEMESKQ